MNYEKEFVAIIEANSTIQEILTIIDELSLPQACLCAGTLRNAVWDWLSGYDMTLVSDVDVIFYDSTISYEQTLLIENELIAAYPMYQWELKNQVYMAEHHPTAKIYYSVYDAISHFPECCTAIGLAKHGEEFQIIAPYGLTDIFEMVIQPTPSFSENQKALTRYHKRVSDKNWQKRWPKLTVRER